MSWTEMYFSERVTQRRGARPSPPFTLPGSSDGSARAPRAVREPCPYAVLTCRRLPGLLLQDLSDESEALQLVRVGGLDAADLRRRLADLLLVDPRDDDVVMSFAFASGAR